MKCQPISNLTLCKVGLSGMMLLYAFWLLCSPVHATTTLFADSFDTLGTHWQLYQNRQIQAPQLPCLNGYVPASWQQARGKLRLELQSPSCLLDLIPVNVELRGVEQYQLSARITLEDSIYMDRTVVLKMSDTENWYGLKLFGTTVQLEKVVGGIPRSIENALAQYPFQANREYLISIIVTRDKHIDVLVDHQQVLDIEDTLPFIQPTSRQFFSLRGSVGAVSHSVTVVDDVKLESLLDQPGAVNLQVPLWKQTDSSWKNQEYDSAHLWSSIPTMNRWGCAVTSMAMILRYYGITQLPSGEALTPQTLNAWLQSQADGYFSGNLNWLAVTRLTQLVSGKLGTPKLEFSRSDGTLKQIIAFATQELNAGKPVILGYPGHFFVADGIDVINTTLLTKDPYYSYQRLNQRPTVNEVNTIRRFQPSHTDLSYLLIHSSPQLQVTLRGSDGQELPLTVATEYLSDPTGESGETSPISQQFIFPKPSSGDYSISISQPTDSPYSLEVFKYDSHGEIAVEHFQGTVGTEAKTLSFTYAKVVETSPIPLPSPSSSPSTEPTKDSPGELTQLQHLLQLSQRLHTAIQDLFFKKVVEQIERLNRQTNSREN